MGHEDDVTQLSDLLALVVHDLRSPVASISANLSFVREVAGTANQEVGEALDDVDVAVTSLTRGLEHLGWVGRWLSREPAPAGAPGDARASIEEALRRVGGEGASAELPAAAVRVRAAGEPLTQLLEVLVGNSRQHAKGAVVVRLTPDAVIEVQDTGRAVSADLRAHAFTMAGQHRIKGRRDGRYGWMIGLLAARALADAIGAELEADGVDGAAVFRIRLPAEST